MANWKISNYYKKSCYEIQTYVKDDKSVHNEVGWRFGTWSVTTTDDKIPEIYWENYGDTPDYSNLHIGSFAGSNVDEVELNETWDSCWEDYDYDGLTEEEIEEIERIIEEEGIWALTDDHGWDYGDCESYLSGPVRIENEDGETVCIVYADKEGNTAILDEENNYTLDLPAKKEKTTVAIEPAAWPFPTPKEES